LAQNLGTRSRAPPIILRVKKLEETFFHMVAYKNLDISFFRFVTMHAFDRLTERPSPYRALHYMQSHGKSECGSGLPSGVISIAYTH